MSETCYRTMIGIFLSPKCHCWRKGFVWSLWLSSAPIPVFPPLAVANKLTGGCWFVKALSQVVLCTCGSESSAIPTHTPGLGIINNYSLITSACRECKTFSCSFEGYWTILTKWETILLADLCVLQSLL